MARFEQSGLFDQMARAGKLTAPLMTRLARRIAAFHASATVDHGGGGAARMATVLDLNRRSLQLAGVFSAAERERLATALQAALDAHAALLDARAGAGLVRRCHGDLHLRNICLIDDEPTLFDCLEFDEALATVDVLYDLAFLLMDLWHRGLGDLANIVFNRYLDQVDDQEGLALLPFFMAVRAAIRAQVAAGQVAENDDEATGLAAEARAYFALALDLLEPRPARLVAVGGLSGSGKSTVAAAIAPGIGPAPGARILSSDRIRKHLFGVSPETRLPAEAYRPEVSVTVYGAIGEAAAAVLHQGHGAVADAVFEHLAERTSIARVAADAAVAFDGLWLDAQPEVLVQRVSTRRGDPSDATPEVIMEQLRRSPAAIDWPRVKTDADREAVCATVRRVICQPGPATPG
ncbi:aminoglycoside phosphotransferase [Oleomonas cavernae]|uniref:Aminoglycoside phosphotransferase n=1 Tax=Oleomonas cavernae TaxID=2320859 RepID=A0A418WFM2_9PROT|nr:bifunctional aminoglycoside phosphotransferase/ATP-binding protein [Oleomonas cavernae]RJF88780.1 aminoglycoside phosphotransferase [Oleomonas cavernae]